MSTQALIPELRFPEFTNPWNTDRLSDLVIFKSGGTPSVENEDYWGGDIPWISAASMEGKYFQKSERTLTEAGLKAGSRISPEGSILLLVRGSMLYNKVPIGLVDKEVAFNQDVKSLIPSERINREFLYEWFMFAQHRLLGLVVGTGIGAGKLDMDDLNRLIIPLPSIVEQQKIASFLTAVDKRIQLLQEKKAQLERYKKSIMQKLFSQEIRFKDENGNNFSEWEFKKAKHVFRNHSNKNHDGDLPILSASQEHGMIYRGDSGIKIQSSEKSVKSYKIVEPNDFVISLRSFQGGLDFSELRGICSPAYTILKNRIPVNYQFYKFYFKKESFIERLSKTVVGIRDGKQITYENFGTLSIPYPSVREQERIAEFLKTLDDSLSTLDQLIKVSQEFKKGLLQKMFVR